MREFLSVAICVIVSLVLLAVATRYVSGIWIFAAIHNLQLHVSIISIAALLLALILKRGLLPGGLLILALVFLGHAIWMSREFVQAPPPANTRSETFKLMSFNILMTNFEQAEAVRDLILSSGADVVNLMEAGPLQAHLQALSTIYPHRLGCGEMTKQCDLMMLSKLPLADRTIVSLSELFEERMMLAKIAFNGQPLHIAAIHTTKPYFDAFQTYELRNAARVLSAIDGPLILSGDFNASTLAPNVRAFLKATGLRTAEREPATWPTQAGRLGIAIDHVFVRSPFAISSLERLADALGSNHYGLVAEIAVAKD
jgi:endonuclease/exonuclease/phosphatase (EEP) superfamily protein YafD